MMSSQLSSVRTPAASARLNRWRRLYRTRPRCDRSIAAARSNPVPGGAEPEHAVHVVLGRDYLVDVRHRLVCGPAEADFPVYTACNPAGSAW